MMECSGKGTVFFAKEAMDILLLTLSGDTVKAESEHLLAIEDGLKADVAFSGVRGATSGQGLFTSTVTGAGTVALVSAGGPPIALEVAGSGRSWSTRTRSSPARASSTSPSSRTSRGAT